MREDIRILIVEDERIVAEHIRQSLIRLSYKISGIASSGKEAFSLAKKKQSGSGSDGYSAQGENGWH